jgi:SAM-dependent methyltransferase
MTSRAWTKDPETWPPESERPKIHWQIERKLRATLLASRPENREDITREVYNRLFDEVPWHDANVADEADENAYEEYWFRLYGPLTRRTDTLLDIGCGRGGLIRQFAPAVADCIGIDASDAMVAIASEHKPANARFVVGNLLKPPLPEASIDFVVSRQVMEHLHPDDVPGHLRAVFQLLRPGGRFLIETPSRLTGPWDISRGFSDTATGFHLREYTNAEMGAMLRAAGFHPVRGPGIPARVLERLGQANRFAYVPVSIRALMEWILRLAPTKLRPSVARLLTVREVTLIAERPQRA